MSFIKKLFISIFVMLPQVGLAQSAMEIAEKYKKLPKQHQELYKDVANQLRCPTCTGLSVLQSDAPFSQQIKNAALDQVMTGQSRADILDFFTERYGLWIRREPPKEGLHLIAWLVPLFLLLAGPILIWNYFWRRKHDFNEVAMRTDTEILNEMKASLKKLKKPDGSFS